jgi:BirA family biotin operon repressor/biotin-[acetyl-CoA-carboxylase] ligase
MSWDRVVDEATSTNDLARELGKAGAPSGAWISALRQTRGRGRLGREWQSDEGNLFLSMVVRNIPVGRASWIPISAGLGAARAILTLCPALDLKLKWPNDLRIGEKKLGGILCEGREEFYVAGIGINCARAPDGLRAAALGIEAEVLRPVLVQELRLAFADLGVASPDAAEYARLAAFPEGTPVRWANGRGTVIGLGPHGELVVRTEDGGRTSLYADDVEAVRAV